MKLKPCPFCGGPVQMIQFRAPLPGLEDVDKGDFEFVCSSCKTATMFFIADHPAEELWNRRCDDGQAD